jgi:4-hydroxy-4-methyl-2-oxoglutarate aldolase
MLPMRRRPSAHTVTVYQAHAPGAVESKPMEEIDMATTGTNTEPLQAESGANGGASSGPPPVATRHDHQGVIVTSIERPASELVASYRALYTGLVLDHLGKHGCMTPDVKPVWSGASLCGPAITCLGADWRIRSMAADLAEPGDVIVLAAGGVTECACFGDMTATCWQSKGIAGVVIDGACRDVARLRALGFPVFAREVTPRNYHYPAGLDHGAINVPVVCGGVLVEPGDIVIGDDDGVVIVPRRIAKEIAAAASAYLEQENAGRATFKEQYVSFGVEEELKGRGYRFV